MLYKKGDFVKIREDLTQGDWHGVYANGEMELMAGSVVQIVEDDVCIASILRYRVSGCSWTWADSMFSGVVGPPMPELKTGMVLELKKGTLVMVFKDIIETATGHTACVSGPDDWFPLYKFGSNGMYESLPTPTIMRIYSPDSSYDYGRPLSEMNKTLVWERSEPVKPAKKMTVAEIQEALGYTVEIVEG